METKKPLIIGLYSPRSQSGKTTVARFLSKHCNFYVASFSRPIKRFVNELLLQVGIDEATINILMTSEKEASIPKMGGKSYRQLCQTLGTDWGRKLVYEDIWLEVMKANLPPDRDIVIDDIRFFNEVGVIRVLGGQMWLVKRDNAPIFHDHDHESEGRLGNAVGFDRVIENNGSLIDLARNIVTGSYGYAHHTAAA